MKDKDGATVGWDVYEDQNGRLLELSLIRYGPGNCAMDRCKHDGGNGRKHGSPFDDPTRMAKTSGRLQNVRYASRIIHEGQWCDEEPTRTSVQSLDTVH